MREWDLGCHRLSCEVSTVKSVETTRAHNSLADDGFGPRPPVRRPPKRARLSAARLQVLETLAEQPEPCTVSAIAAILHQHTNTTREHLDGLVRLDFAVRERGVADGPGRPPWRYQCVEEYETSSSAAEYAGLASALADQIARTSSDPHGDALAAGQSWGKTLIARDDAPPAAAIEPARKTVVELLERLEFSPEPSADGTTVRLRRCPLLEAAYRNPDIVCAVHLGLVQGALSELGMSPDGTSLLPFAEKGACRLHFTPPTSEPHPKDLP